VGEAYISFMILQQGVVGGKS